MFVFVFAFSSFSSFRSFLFLTGVFGGAGGGGRALLSSIKARRITLQYAPTRLRAYVPRTFRLLKVNKQ